MVDVRRTLVRYMHAFHPGHRHVETLLDGIGHSSHEMFSGPVGRDAFFGN